MSLPQRKACRTQTLKRLLDGVQVGVFLALVLGLNEWGANAPALEGLEWGQRRVDSAVVAFQGHALRPHVTPSSGLTVVCQQFFLGQRP